MKKNNSLKYFLSVLILLTACASSVVNEPSDAEINGEAEKAYAEIKTKSKYSNNKEWNEMVQRVAKRIANTTGENFKWEAILIENPEKNAWCMPGGKIAVYTGIMPVLKNEAALAAVLGHEVAHATLRHGKEHYVRAMNQSITGAIIGGAVLISGQFLCKTQSCKNWMLLGGLASGFALTFFERKFSRSDESNADETGQIYMSRAGYDPREAARLWERMSGGGSENSISAWMSTHPSNIDRKNNLNLWLPRAMNEYQNAKIKFGLGNQIK